MQRSTARRFLTLAALSLAGILAGSLAFTQPATPLNNASSALAADHTSGSGTLVLTAGTGGRFGSTFPVIVTVAARSTLVNGQIAPTSVQTIFRVTGRSGDTLTGLTATENTSDRNYHTGDPVQALVTAGMLQGLQDQISAIGGGGSGNALTLQPAGATTAGTLAARAAVTYDAKADFGAGGNGIVNDTAALKAGIAALKAAGGGVLVLPRGTYLITQPLILPSNVTLRGVGIDRSIITRPASVTTPLTANSNVGTFTAAVTATTGLVVGQAVSVWDSSSGDDLIPTWGLITGISGLTVTIDTAMVGNFTTARSAQLGTIFSLIRNEKFATNCAVEDLTINGNRQVSDPPNMFPQSALEWVLAFSARVQRVKILNSVADGYSDQANDYTGVTASADYVTNNVLTDSIIDSPGRHCVHLGSTMHGGSVTYNQLLNAGRGDSTGSVIFYCAFVTRTDFSNNYGFNAAYEAVHGLDVRDERNRITGNTFEQCGGPVNLGDSIFNLIASNHLIELGGSSAIRSNGAADCIVVNNTIRSTTPRTSTILIQAGTRMTVQGNTIAGNAAGSSGVVFSGVTNSEASGNRISGMFYGFDLDASSALSIYGNAATGNQTGFAVRFETDSPDVRLRDNTWTDGVSYDTRPTRLQQNGVGDNGSLNPASSGPWNTISGPRWNGTLVRWDDGAGHNSLALYQNGTWANIEATLGGASHAFVSPDNATAAVTLQGVAGSGPVLDLLANGGARKGRFSYTNFAGTYAGLTIENDPIPDIRLIGNSVVAGEGPAIFMGNATVGEVWQYFMPADTLGFGLLNRRTAGTPANFSFGVYIDAANRIMFGTTPGGSGYLPPTLIDQFVFNVLVASRVGLVVQGTASQSGNLSEWRANGGSVLSTVSENGYFTTRKNAAPADAELATGEAAYWFDPTAGAAKFNVKAKDANGTVVTGSMSLIP